MIIINAYKKADDQSKEKIAWGKRSLTGAMVKGSSCQTTRRGRGEKTKRTAEPLNLLQYVFLFANILFLNEV
jgi:hypothetical protein